MRFTINKIINTILYVSVIFSNDPKLTGQSVILIEQEIKRSSIILNIESDEDIYGIQFTIHYNNSQISLTEEGIVAKLIGANLYKLVPIFLVKLLIYYFYE